MCVSAEGWLAGREMDRIACLAGDKYVSEMLFRLYFRSQRRVML